MYQGHHLDHAPRCLVGALFNVLIEPTILARPTKASPICACQGVKKCVPLNRNPLFVT